MYCIHLELYSWKNSADTVFCDGNILYSFYSFLVSKCAYNYYQYNERWYPSFRTLMVAVVLEFSMLLSLKNDKHHFVFIRKRRS